MNLIQTTVVAVLTSGMCLSQTQEQSGMLYCEAVIQTNVSVFLKNNDVAGLQHVQQQITEMERQIPFEVKDGELCQETVFRLYLRLFRATKEIVLTSDKYNAYIIKKSGYNLVKPMRYPEVARAVAFPNEEATLITNAVLRQELEQYQGAKKQMEDNIKKRRMLEGIQAHILGYFKWVNSEISKQSNNRTIERLRSHIVELIPSEDDRDAIFELFSQGSAKTPTNEKVRSP